MDPTEKPDTEVNINEANQSFMCDLYKVILEEKPAENIFFSPISISMALAMTLAGTQENTENQIRKALGFEGVSQTMLHSSFKSLLEEMTGAATSEPGTVSLANGLFVQNNFKILSSFVETVKMNYNAVSKNLDFANNPKDALSVINHWVKDATREKIPDLLKDVDPLTVLIIVNAIHFKSLWMHKFDPKNTTVLPFYTNEHDSVQVKMMFLKEDFRYAFNEAADCDVLELPYLDKKTSMVIFLPKKVDGLSKVESQLSPSFLNHCLSSFGRPTEVELQLPSFKLEESYSLAPVLKTLGVTDLFVPHVANLGGISQESDLYVSQVIHKSAVEVNEEGTEAAAATAIGFVFCCMTYPIPFKADHPFIFCILDNNSKNILFIGSLKNPKPV